MPPVALEGDFVNAQIGDVDGDGSPELVLVMNLTRFGDNSTPHVFIATYTWDGTHFSEIPSATLDVGKENRSLRCNNFELLDQDADGDQELVLALGSAVALAIDAVVAVTAAVVDVSGQKRESRCGASPCPCA